MRTMSVVGGMVRFKVPRLKWQERSSALHRMAPASWCSIADVA
jgi:hypothetical protein